MIGYVSSKANENHRKIQLIVNIKANKEMYVYTKVMRLRRLRG
jgi:hypothetical protein